MHFLKDAMSIRVSSPPPKPLMLFDGDCGFCRAWVKRWKDTTGNEVDYAPSQQAAPRFPEIPAQTLNEAVQLVETDGMVYSGAEAVFRALAHRRRARWLRWCYQRVPGFRLVSEFLYGIIASHRPLFSAIIRFLYGRQVARPPCIGKILR